MNATQRFSMWYFLAALVALLLIQSFLFPQHTETLPYSEFKTLLKQGKVDNVSVAEQTITRASRGSRTRSSRAHRSPRWLRRALPYA